ncbi:hypothetical protein ACIF6L_34865 [Kitasatospora sp. NPDC086009]|uniref:hypothetical protein n=1 Tax=unclassified Kitasatospora TaxID=2633591 RepID=UPI0037C644B9
MPRTTITVTAQAQLRITVDQDELEQAHTAETLDTYLLNDTDRMAPVLTATLPDGTVWPLDPAATPPKDGDTVQAIAVALYEDVIDSGRTGPIANAERLLRALGIEPAQVIPF